MFAFRTAVDEFITRAATGTSMKEVNAASRRMADHLDAAGETDLNDALRRLAGVLPGLHPLPAAAVALACGSCVERGGDPALSGGAVLGRLPGLLRGTVRFYDACRERAEADVSLRATEEGDEGDEPSPEDLAEKYLNAVLADEPDAAYAHAAEQGVRLSAIAHLGRSKSLRAVARSRPELLAASGELDRVFAGGHGFLTKMLLVLDDEPLVVLDARQGKGFRVTVSGVPVNFNLHELLMGHLVGDPADGWIEAKGFDTGQLRTAVSGMANESGGVSGLFNLWNWTGVQPDGALPAGTSGSDHWIWNEGVPADIRPFDGTRVVVIGRPPYSRNWNVGRVFLTLVPELRVDEKLPPATVGEWLRRLGTAPRG